MQQDADIKDINAFVLAPYVTCGALCADSAFVWQVQVEVPPAAAKGTKEVKTY